MKDDDRNIEDIPAVELNEYICQFIISVCTKDGNEYKPTSLRSLVASFERRLKKKTCSAIVTNDFGLRENQKSSSVKTKAAQKAREGTVRIGSFDKRRAENIIRERFTNLTGTCSPGALLNTLYSYFN